MCAYQARIAVYLVSIVENEHTVFLKTIIPSRKATKGGRRLTPKKRQAIAERLRRFWAERRLDARRRKASESP
jgi:hypothetical protein